MQWHQHGDKTVFQQTAGSNAICVTAGCLTSWMPKRKRSDVPARIMRRRVSCRMPACKPWRYKTCLRGLCCHQMSTCQLVFSLQLACNKTAACEQYSCRAHTCCTTAHMLPSSFPDCKTRSTSSWEKVQDHNHVPCPYVCLSILGQ